MKLGLWLASAIGCGLTVGWGTGACAVEPSGASWPQWRGPSGQGHAETAGLPLQWEETKNVRWRCSVPGRGWSSPIIADRLIWMTTALETPAKPEDVQRRLEVNTGGQPLTLLEEVTLKAVAIDQNTGQLVHDVRLLAVREPQWVHKLNSYASPTPVYEAGKLYCHFGAFGTVCLDTQSAKVDWTNTELQVMHENGPGGSPILVGENLVFHMDGSDKQFIAALDKRTGKLAWKENRSGKMLDNPQQKKSYGTPIVVEIGGEPHIVSPATDWVYGYEPKSGRELWKVPYGQLGFSLTPRPVVGHGMIYVITGFGKGQLLAIDYQHSMPPQVVWRLNRGTPTMPSPLLVGEELYFVSDNGILTCLDAKSGEELYRERLSGNFSSSPWYAEGRIYVSNREGTTFVVQAGRAFKLLAENSLPEAILATPAAVEGAIYLRTEANLYRIENESPGKG